MLPFNKIIDHTFNRITHFVPFWLAEKALALFSPGPCIWLSLYFELFVPVIHWYSPERPMTHWHIYVPTPLHWFMVAYCHSHAWLLSHVWCSTSLAPRPTTKFMAVFNHGALRVAPWFNWLIDWVTHKKGCVVHNCNILRFWEFTVSKKIIFVFCFSHICTS